ncbi:MAG: acyltransferase [Mycobacterium sp.]
MTTNRRSIGQTFTPRHNALNALRLFFALMVIVSHSLNIGGYRSEDLWSHTRIGGLAVNAFFAVSGFLITAAAQRTTVGRYMWHRFLRIFPGFWVCLLLTAAIAGPIGWLAAHRPLGSYWGPGAHYLVSNSLLMVSAFGIDGTPSGIPYPGRWNDPVWTLSFEFVCYLLVAALAATALLKRRRVVLLLWLAVWALNGVVRVTHVLDFLDAPVAANVSPLLRFLPIFFAGAVMWLYRDKIPDDPRVFVGALAVFVGGTFLPDPDVVSGPPLAYVCIWAAIHLPGKRVGSRHDISYGVYIYAFVVAQLMALGHLYRWGYLPFTALTLAISVALAWLSCVLVEQPALRMKNWSPRKDPVNSSARGQEVVTAQGRRP